MRADCFKNQACRLLHLESDSQHRGTTQDGRERQVEELKEMAMKRRRVVVAGDFNVFGGFEELFPLTEGAGLQILNRESDYTFPSSGPKKSLDLFLVSRNVFSNFKLRIIRNNISDHSFVFLEYERSFWTIF